MRVLIGWILPGLMASAPPTPGPRRFLMGELLPTLLETAPGAFPYDLAGAVAARYQAQASTLTEITKLYESEAGERPIMPYLIYKIVAGATLLTTDTDFIFDQRVTFKVYAGSQPQANALREAVHAAFGSGSYAFQTGFSIPFFQKDRSESKHSLTGINGQLVFWAGIDYSARTHRS